MAFSPADSFSANKPESGQPRGSRKSRSGGLGIAFFAFFWTALVLAFDGYIGYGFYRTYQAQSYLETTGVVTKSEVKRRRSSNGSSYHPDIEFRYEVDGQAFEGDQYAYGVFGTSGGSLAWKAVRKFPEGKQVPVYYHPTDPTDAILDRSYDSLPLFILLFLTPFNMVMVGLWWAASYSIGRSLFGKEEGTVGGYDIVQDGVATRVKIGYRSPMLMGFIGVGAASFISIFAIAFFKLTENSAALMGAVLFMLVAAFGGAWWQSQRNASGKADLVLDRSNMKLIIPASLSGTPTELSLIELNTVEVKHVRGNKNSVSYAPTVTYLDRNQIRQEVTICQWASENAAHELADWLRQELGLQA